MQSETVLPLLLYSLGEASTGPDRIEMFLRHNPVPDRSFDLSPSFMQSEAAPVLSNLRALLLSLHGNRNPHQDGWYEDPSHADFGFGCLRRFLQHTPLLEQVRLNFKNTGVPERHTDEFLAWLGKSPGPDVNATPTPVKLNHLTTLELGMVIIAPNTLLDLVSKFAKLEAVSLWKIELQPLRGIPEEVGFNDDTSIWAYCLRKIGEAFQAPENVKTFMIGWVAEVVDPGRVPSPVRFAGKTNVDGNGAMTFEDAENVVKYRKEVGSNVRTWLHGLTEKAFVQPSEILSSDDEDEDEDSQIGDSESDGSLPDGFEDGDNEAGITDDL